MSLTCRALHDIMLGSRIGRVISFHSPQVVTIDATPPIGTGPDSTETAGGVD
jgi:hypothetical protein